MSYGRIVLHMNCFRQGCDVIVDDHAGLSFCSGSMQAGAHWSCASSGHCMALEMSCSGPSSCMHHTAAYVLLHMMHPPELLAALTTIAAGHAQVLKACLCAGKGMHSRLYKRVLNKYGWMQNCTGFNSLYDTTGIAGISATFDTRNASQGIDIISKELLVCAPELTYP